MRSILRASSVFVQPSHESIKIARLEGFSARMIPGISAEDCLFADIGLDPGKHGCQSFEATDFLVRKREFNSKSPSILWQVGAIGDLYYHADDNNTETKSNGLGILGRILENYYDKDHEVILYQASQLPLCQPNIQHVPLSKIHKADVRVSSTMYVPPNDPQILDEDIISRLGMARRILTH